MANTPLRPKSLLSVRTMVILALLSALSIILELFLGINSGQFKLNFSYLPIAVAGMLYGVVPAVLVATVSDILSNLGNFAWPFVLLAALEGAVYGFFLHRRKNEKKQMILQALYCQLLVSLVIHAGLNTLLLYTLYRFFDPIRFLINGITFPIKVFTLYKILEYRPVLEKHA